MTSAVHATSKRWQRSDTGLGARLRSRKRSPAICPAQTGQFLRMAPSSKRWRRRGWRGACGLPGIAGRSPPPLLLGSSLHSPGTCTALCRRHASRDTARSRTMAIKKFSWEPTGTGSISTRCWGRHYLHRLPRSQYRGRDCTGPHSNTQPTPSGRFAGCFRLSHFFRSRSSVAVYAVEGSHSGRLQTAPHGDRWRFRMRSVFTGR